MGASTVGLWEQAVKLLQDGTKDPDSCSDPSLYTRAEALVERLDKIVAPPKATMKKLVQQRQVNGHHSSNVMLLLVCDAVQLYGMWPVLQDMMWRGCDHHINMCTHCTRQSQAHECDHSSSNKVIHHMH